MSAQETAMNLGNLPSDVIRKIITVGLNSVDDLRLVSPRWNFLVLKHLQNRSRLPSITECNCVLGRDIRIGICFPPALKKYFGLQKKHSGLDTRPVSFGEIVIDSAQLMKETGKEIDFLKRLFRRCSFVGLIDVQMCSSGSRTEIKLISHVTGPLKIDNLWIRGAYSNFDVDDIVHMVKFNSVRILNLCISDIEFMRRLGDFYVEASSYVSMIKFTGGFEYKGDVGVFRAEWQAITDSMNKSGKTTATLDNEFIDGFLSKYLNVTITVIRKEAS